MTRYVLERIFYVLVTAFIIVSITFVLLQFMPGTPFLDDKLTAEQSQILLDKYGLDDPLPVQYVRYMGKIIQGDFGRSFKTNRTVTSMIMDRVKVSATVGFQALLFGSVVGITLGAVAGLNRGKLWDHLTIVIAVIGVSIPSFVFGSLMQFALGVQIQIFPVIYMKTFASTLMPTFALALYVVATTARYMRNEIIEVLNSDYILLAKAKGLSRPTIIVKHALRNALIPVITVIGPLTVILISGTVVVERIFAVPGLGNMIVTAIQSNDHFVILGEGIFFSLIFLTAILTVDILYGIIDPRIRLAGGKN